MEPALAYNPWCSKDLDATSVYFKMDSGGAVLADLAIVIINQTRLDQIITVSLSHLSPKSAVLPAVCMCSCVPAPFRALTCSFCIYGLESMLDPGTVVVAGCCESEQILSSDHLAAFTKQIVPQPYACERNLKLLHPQV